MITITLSGTDTAEAQGIVVKGRGMTGPINSLARKLIEAGNDPETPVQVVRGETVCFQPTVLSYWADNVATESAALSVKMKKYIPMPENLHQEGH